MATGNQTPGRLSRRRFVQCVGTTAGWVCAGGRAATPGRAAATPPGNTYETHAKGIRILPGAWRPHYPWEQIAWVSPAWPSQEYLWLDFPEAIFVGRSLLFLSHLHPEASIVYPELPPVPWRPTADGIAFVRVLPNGLEFGGSVTREDATTVRLDLRIKNGSREPLREITLQTCAYLRGIKEFADYTRDNKFVHVPDAGWIPLSQALTLPPGGSPYRAGWRTKGKPVVDWPVLVTKSNVAERWVGMTWRQDTLSLIGNPNHPCMHADPKLKDLEPGESASLRGALFFFEGPLANFDVARIAGR